MYKRQPYYISSPGIEPGTFRVLGGCDNHYTTITDTLQLLGGALKFTGCNGKETVQFHKSERMTEMRRLGIELGPPAWKAGIITIRLTAHVEYEQHTHTVPGRWGSRNLETCLKKWTTAVHFDSNWDQVYKLNLSALV